jgi:hypothetical protein
VRECGFLTEVIRPSFLSSVRSDMGEGWLGHIKGDRAAKLTEGRRVWGLGLFFVRVCWFAGLLVCWFAVSTSKTCPVIFPQFGSGPPKWLTSALLSTPSWRKGRSYLPCLPHRESTTTMSRRGMK